MLRSAFNALTKFHSRAVTIKRLGTPDIYSSARVTPANFFRFTRGPEYTTISGKEFIIPVDSMTGQFSQSIVFAEVPIAGDFKLRYSGNDTTAILFSATADDIQTALRLLPGLSYVTVSGDFSVGFSVLFNGAIVKPSLLSIVSSTLGTTGTISHTMTAWEDKIRKGDRIIDSGKFYAVDEIMDMHDVGATIMGYRVRAD